MLYGRTANGEDVWHIIVNGRPMCFPNFTIVETRESGEFERDHVCDNCDGRLREAGRAKAPSKSAFNKPRKYYNPKTIYNPKNKFKDF